MPGSPFDRRRQAVAPVCALLVLSTGVIPEVPASTALWAAPAMLAAAMLIAWAAESAQFFIAQGFALAILAWLQTLPEFAVEAVLALERQVPLLMAGLTGALRLLTGLGWPMIYFTAAFFHRRKYKAPLGKIVLPEENSVEIVGLLAAMVYIVFIWLKASIDLFDAGILIGVYIVYLLVLRHMPAEGAEGIEDLERIPRAIVTAPKRVRVSIIGALFLAGGGLIYFMAEPFLASLLALSTAAGVPEFIFIQWVAPFVSEFPEKVSAFYWARTVERSPTALMNMVSSNINQWTLLVAMLPIAFSIGMGVPSAIPLDSEQELELLLTLAQAALGAIFLVDMKLVWWEAAGLFGLWAVQFAFSPVPPGPGVAGFISAHIRVWVTAAYLVWLALELIRMAAGKRHPAAFRQFAVMWGRHVRRVR